MGAMSRDDQIHVGLAVIFGLALECVIEGVVFDAPSRLWIVHLATAAIATVGLTDGRNVTRLLAGASGIAVFVNDLALVWNRPDRWRAVAPTLVILGVSIGVVAAVASAPAGMTEPRQVSRQRHNVVRRPGNALAADVVGIVGSLILAFAILRLAWVRVSVLGLLDFSLNMSDLRIAEDVIDLLRPPFTQIVEWGYVLLLAGAAAGALLLSLDAVVPHASSRGLRVAAAAIGSFLSCGTLLGFVDIATTDFVGLEVGAYVGVIGAVALAVGAVLSARIRSVDRVVTPVGSGESPDARRDVGGNVERSLYN
jgi:hypothetical protein